MSWLEPLLFDQDSVSTSVLILALVIALGLALGNIRYRGVRLGVAGVLFSGLIFGHFGMTISSHALEFIREMGLILFVYAVGLAVGPGFFNALKAQGLKLNLLAAGIVLLAVVLTLVISWAARVPLPIAVGMFSGATTNTPSLASSGQALKDHPPRASQARAALEQVAPEQARALPEGELGEEESQKLLDEVARMPGIGYAITYPFGVVGIILSMLVLRSLFKVDPAREAEEMAAQQRSSQVALERMAIRVSNPNLTDVALGKIPALDSLRVVVSRVLRGEEMLVARADFKLTRGDVLLAVGPAPQLEELRMIVGEKVDPDLVEVPSTIGVRWLLVTRKHVVGEQIGELHLTQRHPVQITRLRRAGVELPPLQDMHLSLGDEVLVVGPPEAIAAVAHELGNSPLQLQTPELIPIFVGIGLGIVLGSWPIWLPGLPSAFKLGLAGGPLLVAILLSRFQRVGSLVWYLPTSASLLLKDLGIAFFLAAVGLKSGDRFLATLIQGSGLWWMLWGALITMGPLLLAGLVGYRVMKVRFLTLVGVLAGSMTDPPALAFANTQAQSEMPAIAYATVYPLTMILRVLSTQLLVMFWTG